MTPCSVLELIPLNLKLCVVSLTLGQRSTAKMILAPRTKKYPFFRLMFLWTETCKVEIDLKEKKTTDVQDKRETSINICL
jgi:hypothetical protein